jgi:putative acetyltransferase
MCSLLIITRGDPRDPQAAALLRTSHALMLDLFPAEDNYALRIEDLLGEDIRFFVARLGEAFVGTGALQIKQGYGEVKSMFTTQEARGKGVAAALLRQIEDEARAHGLPLLRLETGAALAAAIRLYERHGFTPCPRFGAYAENQTSLYMEKRLIP